VSRTEAPLLHTERLVLEPLRPEHADEMAPVLDDPGLHTYTGGVPESRDALRGRYERQARGRSPDGSQQWLNWVLRRRDDGLTVGTVQATVAGGPDGPIAEVAWVIGAVHQRRGYAREAAEAMLRHLRDSGVTTVVAHVHPEHQASMSVARALGLAPSDAVVGGEVRWTSGA
jgi:RimJ/RimL family protein N-acetyltransferase